MKNVWYIAAILVVMSFVMLGVSQETGSAAMKTPPVKIGFIGDSITHGRDGEPTAVDADIAALGKNYSGINRGVSGSTTQDWLPGAAMFDDALADFKAQNVHIVSIMLGTNDARKEKAISPKTYRQNLIAITKKLLASGTVRQVIVNYPPYAVPKSSDADYSWKLEAYRSQIDELVRDKVVLRGDTQSYNYFKDHQSELADGTHPTKEGYAHLGQLWAAAYKRLVQAHARATLFSITLPGSRVQ